MDILRNTLNKCFFFLGKFYHGHFFSEIFLELCVINLTLYVVITFWCLYSGFRNIWTLFSNGLYYTWYWFLFFCLPRFNFFLKLVDINSIFDFRITNSQEILSLPSFLFLPFLCFPFLFLSVLCENPIKAILKVTSSRLS